MIELDEYLAARHRPERRVLMHMSWRHLLFAHFPVDPAAVQATLPNGLSVGTFPDASGVERAWIGVIPFTMHGIRPQRGPALPWISSFHETNVRTYVHRKGKRPGIWFYSLDAARWLACQAARLSFGLPYRFARMAMHVEGPSIFYRTNRVSNPKPAHLNLKYTIGQPLESKPGSFEFWLVERYHLFAVRRQSLLTAQVHHQPYGLNTAEVLEGDCSLTDIAGFPLKPWEHVAYCQGVDVEVFTPELLRS